MSKQPTLLSFFTRTPKAATGSPNGSGIRNGESPSTSTNGEHRNGGDAKVSTPKSSIRSSLNSSSSVSASPKTPTSRSNGVVKRKRIENDSVAPGDQGQESRKKIRSIEQDSPPKEFSAGSLVWALLEGYPWWPAMIRGEIRGGSFYKAESMEFHVQFFDDPPTRAWLRKGNLKPFAGSTDADITPAKSDKSWLEACKSADSALSLRNKERLEQLWHEFDMEEGEKIENGEMEQEEEVEELEVEERKETPKSSRRGREASKKHRRIRAISSSDEEKDEDSKAGRKKKKDDDVYSTTKNDSVEEESESSEAAEGSGDDSNEVLSEDEDDSDGDSKRRGKKKIAVVARPSTSTAAPKDAAISKTEFKNRINQFNASTVQSSNPTVETFETNSFDKEQTTWTHMTWPWAQVGKRMDLRKRKEDNPDYDPRTLFVPLEFLKSLTPAMRQWWELKSKNFDTILFFKVGKFYEFYHWDACIAVKELGFTFMKGDYAHSGFPEISFSRFANILVEKGYKIARVEQTETPEKMAERIKNSKVKLEKHEKVISREICQVSTKGVRYASFQDDAISSPFSPESIYLYGIVEKSSSSQNVATTFGVCFIDTTIGTFHVGQFTDDRHASRLRTLFSHFVPAQILYERNKISPTLQSLFQNMSGVRKDPLISDTEFWNAKKTLKYISEQDCFQKMDSSTPKWPAAFETLLSENDNLGLTPDENWELGVKSLGGVLFYLKYCLLDHDLLSQNRFEIYKPVDTSDATTGQQLPQRCVGQKYMILDGITIRNLDILTGPNNLFSTIDKCGTNFGRRLLRHWICLPLAIPAEISERLDAIEDLMKRRECRDAVTPLMRSLPDLERLLSKIHYLGSAHRSKQHPDGRASFYEEVKYSKNKIADFLSILKGFKTCVKIIQQFKSTDSEDGLQSKLLKHLVESFPNLVELLTAFDNAFDHQIAMKEGKIKPKKGAIEAYDDAVQAVIDVQSEADDYLREVSRELGTRAVYFGSDKKRFQIEVSEKVKVPKTYEMSSSKKGFKRYYNNAAKEFLASIMRAESEREEVLRDIARKIFEKFDKHRETWSKAAECIANLDALISLSLFSESQEVMCRPVISYSDDRPFIDIVEGRHPCIALDSFIPNDTKLGLDESSGNFVILTGPNMGGKSTLMRQVGLMAVLSHLGCYVPAEKCEMSVVDRVFTRLGANDNIGEGESTFFVEMSETSAILQHASPDSLLLIDELGRGTATYDGTAIAYAVAKELSARNCRSLFSTHYHTLVEALQDNRMIQMSHMACMVENENEEDPTQESITFLYKMISGPCPKSYGFNAARLAGISDEVIRVAHKKAKELESSVTGIRSFTEICSKIRQKKLTLKDFASLKL